MYIVNIKRFKGQNYILHLFVDLIGCEVEGSECQNGGTCEDNGECTCTDMHTGTHCETGNRIYIGHNRIYNGHILPTIRQHEPSIS